MKIEYVEDGDMAIPRGYRFPIEFSDRFPQGPVPERSVAWWEAAYRDYSSAVERIGRTTNHSTTWQMASASQDVASAWRNGVWPW